MDELSCSLFISYFFCNVHGSFMAGEEEDLLFFAKIHEEAEGFAGGGRPGHTADGRIDEGRVSPPLWDLGTLQWEPQAPLAVAACLLWRTRSAEGSV